MAPGQIAMRFGARGPNYATTSACASGAHAHRRVAGPASATAGRTSCSPAGPRRRSAVLGDRRLQRPCVRSPPASTTSRRAPAGRSTAIARASSSREGAAMLVLEALEHAQARGARIYAEVAGYGANCDAYHMTQPAPEGVGAAECMEQALADARLGAGDVGYVNAHGTGTPYNDEAETPAIKRVFGEHACAPGGELHQVDDRATCSAPRAPSRPSYTVLALAARRRCRPPSTSRSPTRPAISTTCRNERAPGGHRRRAVQLLRLRRHERDARLPPLRLSRTDRPPSCSDRRLHFVVGKGGVGKTTVAAALALVQRAARPTDARRRDGHDRAARRGARRARRRRRAAPRFARESLSVAVDRRPRRARGVPRR